MNAEELKAYGKNIKEKNRKNFWKKIRIGILGLVCIIFTVKCAKGDYKFVFQTIEYTNCEVLDTKIYNQGRFSTQEMLYQFTTTNLRILRSDEMIRIKYAKENPKVHEVLW